MHKGALLAADALSILFFAEQWVKEPLFKSHLQNMHVARKCRVTVMGVKRLGLYSDCECS